MTIFVSSATIGHRRIPSPQNSTTQPQFCVFVRFSRRSVNDSAVTAVCNVKRKFVLMSCVPETRASLILRLPFADDGVAWQEVVSIYLPMCDSRRTAGCGRSRACAERPAVCSPGCGTLAARSSAGSVSHVALSNCSPSVTGRAGKVATASQCAGREAALLTFWIK